MNSKTIDIEPLDWIGSGANAIVRRALYKNELVAAKIFKNVGMKNDSEFMKEIMQLKRLNHPNIIKLIAYGKWRDTHDESNCMILELADCGSLHSVLYDENELSYSVGHGINWLHQLAEAINYLHSRTPKPIVHRDLKPLNLLLMKGGLMLKVCDFGTVCDLKTIMSVNRGSPCWMAPELLLQDGKYNEKCDVFSYAIILWEIFARLMPYFHLPSLTGTQIMFSVGRGTLRPKVLAEWPRIIELLFHRGIDTDTTKRPSMQFISNVMTQLNKMVNKTPLQPLISINNEPPRGLAKSTSSIGNSIESLKSPFQTAISVNKVIGNKNTGIIHQEDHETPNFELGVDDLNGSELHRYQPGRLSYNNCEDFQNQPNIRTHRRSKSHGNDLAVVNWNVKSDIDKWESNIESTIYNPIEPMYNDNQSISIFNYHKQLIKKEADLARELSVMKQQRDQLASTLSNIESYSSLMKQKTRLMDENARLKSVLHSKQFQ